MVYLSMLLVKNELWLSGAWEEIYFRIEDFYLKLGNKQCIHGKNYIIHDLKDRSMWRGNMGNHKE